MIDCPVAPCEDLSPSTRVVLLEGELAEALAQRDRLNGQLAAARSRIAQLGELASQPLEEPGPARRSDVDGLLRDGAPGGEWIEREVDRCIDALLEVHEPLVLLCEPPGCSQDEYDAASDKVVHAKDALRRLLTPPPPPADRQEPTEAQLAEWERLAAEATPGPWDWWTSCSFRRLSHEGDGDVLCGTIQRSDGHPDVLCKEADRAFIAAARTAVPALLAALKARRGDK